MDVNYINPFLSGAIEVLHKMAFVEALPGKPYVKADSTACGDVSGIIGITGNVRGSLAISFSEQCILGVASSMLSEKYTDICRDVFDTVGEITNMVSGVARTHLERQGLVVYAAIPTVIYGKNHIIMHILKSPSIVIPFSTPHGDFFVDVCIQVEKPAKTASPSIGPSLSRIYKPDIFAVPEEIKPENRVATALSSPTQASSIAARASAAAGNPGETLPETPLTMEEKLAATKSSLAKLKDQHNEVQRLLKEKPFMDMQQRKKLTKLLPVLDEKIKRCKLDIRAIELLMTMNSEDDGNSRITTNYQNYEN